MKPTRLVFGVLPALACTSVFLGLGACSDATRKEPTPGDIGRGPTKPPAAASPTATGAEEAKAAKQSAPAAKTGQPVSPTVKQDNGRDVSPAHELPNPSEDETVQHQHPRAVAKGTLEGLDVEGKERWTCREERAYRPKAAVVFGDLAPTPLTEALNEVAKKAVPMSLVFQRRDGQLQAALSATRSNGANKEAFLPGKEAPFAPLVLAFGGDPTVTTDAPLPRGYVQLFDKKGPVVLELRRLLWKATRGASCDEVDVDVHAMIPFAQYGLTLHLASGDKTIAELAGVPLPPEGTPDEGPPRAGEPGSQPVRLAVHFTFKAASTGFDGGTR